MVTDITVVSRWCVCYRVMAVNYRQWTQLSWRALVRSSVRRTV